MARKSLGELLTQAGILDEKKLQAAMAEQAQWGGHLPEIFLDMKFTSEEGLVQALSRQANLPIVKLEDKPVPDSVLDLVPLPICEQNLLIPFAADRKFLDVAVSDPTNNRVVSELQVLTHLTVRSHIAGPKVIGRKITECYGRREKAAEAPLFDPNMDYGAEERRRMRDSLNPGPEPDSGVFDATAPLSEVTRLPQKESSPAATTSASLGSNATGRAAPRLGFTPAIGIPAANLLANALGANEGKSGNELAQLRSRVEYLEQLLARDEDVIRKLMALLIQKGICTREELMKQMK